MSCSRFAGLLAVFLSLPACDSGNPLTSGGGGTTSSTASASTSAATTTASTTASTSSATTAATTSSSGTGGAPAWPTCDTEPTGSTAKTIPQIWTDNPTMPAPEWIEGVFVTAVARNGCVANQSCDIFIQQDETYASFSAAASHSIHIGIAPAVAEHFVGIKVGDKVDAYGFASRNTQNGQNELMILVTPTLVGCMKVVGTGAPMPVAATLEELTVAGYEATGPVFLTVSNVSGKPQTPSATFALWDTATGPTQPIDEVTNLSPFYVDNEAFTGLTQGVVTKWSSVTGVFGIFVPPSTPVTKYEELYIRTMADAVP